MTRRFLTVGLGILLLGIAAEGRAQTSESDTGSQDALSNAACLECHGMEGMEPYIDSARFANSIHGSNQCISCHTDITEIPHAAPLQPVSCAQCHPIETEIYLESDHGIAVHKGVSEAASCRDCHGDAHALLNSRNPDSKVNRRHIAETCAACHADVEKMAGFELRKDDAVITYQRSIHGRAMSEEGDVAAAVCTDCHSSHDLHRATNPESKLYWQNIPQTCGKCHENIQRTFLRSAHGAGVLAGERDAPVCTDCHGEHEIAGVKEAESLVFPANVPNTCGECHAAARVVARYNLPPDVVESYMESYHGLSTQLGSVVAANCASCHGAHDILPSTDPRSSIHPDNLAMTCGKCHAGASAQVAKGQIHSGTQPGATRRYTDLVRTIYLWLIGLVIGGMVFHNGLDFRKKLRLHIEKTLVAGARERMDRSMRIQHGVLILSFVLLAYSGFALKFPGAWWAAPFSGHPEWRAWTHRVAAFFFTLLSAYHAGFLLFSRRGRDELRALLPKRRDLAEPAAMMQYYLGRRKERPVFARYSYVEKAEYWALVWGSVVMILTGTLLLWEAWSLRVFPKWAVDVFEAIHFYEAILACLAILVWHMYFVIFDPDEYPMKHTWLSGKDTPADMHHRKEESDERRATGDGEGS